MNGLKKHGCVTKTVQNVPYPTCNHIVSEEIKMEVMEEKEAAG